MTLLQIPHPEFLDIRWLSVTLIVPRRMRITEKDIKTVWWLRDTTTTSRQNRRGRDGGDDTSSRCPTMRLPVMSGISSTRFLKDDQTASYSPVYLEHQILLHTLQQSDNHPYTHSPCTARTQCARRARRPLPSCRIRLLPRHPPNPAACSEKRTWVSLSTILSSTHPQTYSNTARSTSLSSSPSRLKMRCRLSCRRRDLRTSGRPGDRQAG
jgi:hypothetical protein